MKRIPRSIQFTRIYELVCNNTLSNIADLPKEELNRYSNLISNELTEFEQIIISAKIIDNSSLDNSIKKPGIKILIYPTLKKIGKIIDIINYQYDIKLTYFDKFEWEKLNRLKGLPSINTRTGMIENNKESLERWSKVIESDIFKYATFILNYITEGKTIDINYTAGADIVSDMEYYVVGAIYSLFNSTSHNEIDNNKIILLDKIANHLKIFSFKRWERRLIFKDFLEESKMTNEIL